MQKLNAGGQPKLPWKGKKDAKGLSPEFRATRLSRRTKKGSHLGVFCLFPVFKAEKDLKKSARNPGHQ